jgi:type III secretion system YscQ/HrcQ family protein
MGVGPFPFERVPRLCRRELSQLRALRAALGEDREAALARWASRLGLPADEPCSLQVRLLHDVEPTPALGFVLRGPGGRRAGLLLDGALAASLAALMLRAPTTPLRAPASPGERGLLGYAVAALLQELGPLGWSVGLEEPAGEQGALLEAHVRLGARGGGLAWLALDEHGVPAAPPGPLDLERARGLWLSLPLELTRLRLPADELPTLGADDVVLSPRCPAPGATELAALLRVGAGGFPARVSGSAACIQGPFRMGGPEMAQPDEKRRIAEQLELEVVVELGRARLSGAQLLELSPGDVVALERPLDAPLELRVGDKLVARGELCSVEGETGIRLLELYD